MFFNIWRKEFLKLNKPLAALLIFHAGIAFYYWLSVRSSFIAGNPINIWLNVIGMNTFFFSIFEKPLYLTGAALGILQFYPEAEKHRFRLSCHLPANEYLITVTIILFAACSLTFFWLFDSLCAALVSVRYFPTEISAEAPLIIFYWYINALLFYAAASVLTLEPSWKHKIRLFIMLAAFYKLIDISIYNSSRLYIIYLIIIAALFTLCVLYPAERFRKGIA
jgi:hypothetical protein